MDIQYSSDGIYLPAIDLWLDPQVSKPAAWISHAHSDHARYFSQVVLGTAVSLEVYRMRWPADPEQPQTLIELAPGKPVDWNGARLTSFPAGHILGAAQLLVEFESQRLVYTGDLKLRQPMCGEKTQIVPCDQLIIESTFGLPIYHFLSADEARDEMVNFARECLEDGATPAFLGYPLGRGQEIVHALSNAGISVAVHGAIAKYIPVYERSGYQFPGWSPYEAGDLKGRALAVVPGMRRLLEASGRDIRVAYVSGWARLDNARLRANAEKLIPYSDHGDFDELLQMVRATGAQSIDVVHGYTDEFAGILRAQGLNANAPSYVRARPVEEVPE